MLKNIKEKEKYIEIFFTTWPDFKHKSKSFTIIDSHSYRFLLNKTLFTFFTVKRNLGQIILKIYISKFVENEQRRVVRTFSLSDLLSEWGRPWGEYNTQPHKTHECHRYKHLSSLGLYFLKGGRGIQLLHTRLAG